MLKFYRKHIKLFIWLIVLSFVGWGIGTITFSKEGSSSYIGIVGKAKISYKEFLTTSRFYVLLDKANFNNQNAGQEKNKAEVAQSKPLSFEELRGLTWQEIVLSREAKRAGISISDEEVRKEVERLFSANGAFDSAFYESWIRNYFRSRPRDFEEAVRKYLSSQKLREQILKGVPEGERENRWRMWLIPVLSHTKFVDYEEKKEAKNQNAEGKK